MAEVVLDPPMREMGTLFEGEVWLRDQYRDIVDRFYHPDSLPGMALRDRITRGPRVTGTRYEIDNFNLWNLPGQQLGTPFNDVVMWRKVKRKVRLRDINHFPFWNHTIYIRETFSEAIMRAERTWRIRTRPDKWRPTLSSWLKNMNKLDSLVNCLQKLASSSPEHRSQLLNKVVALRATFKRQQERLFEFLQLSEVYANQYIHNISAEIQQQSTVLDNLEERLEAAKKLHGEAVDLHMFYESGTVAAMNDLRATGLPRPLPEDNALFSDVDLALAEIRVFYEELKDFWTEEIRYVVGAFSKGRTDPRDLERWNNFHSSLKQTIESWKNRPPGSDAQPDNTSSQTGVDLGAIASSLSPTIGSLSETLESVSSCASLKYSQLGRSSFQRVYVAFARNSDLCLSFLWNCAGYGEKVFVWCLFSFASPTSSRAGASHDLRERITELRSEGISVENAASAQGSRKFKTAYNKALTLEQEITSGLNSLLEVLSSWAAVADGPSDDALPDVTLEQLGDLKRAWEKARDSVRAALVTQTGEQVQRVTHTGFGFKRWMKSLVGFS